MVEPEATTEQPLVGPFIITGLSGSGKTVLSRSLEDIGYQCVDNIPLDLVPRLFEQPEEARRRLVVVLDIRARDLPSEFDHIFDELKRRDPDLRAIFVEASPETLMRRFSVARRPHPLRDRSLEQAISDERGALAAVRSHADLIIDTTSLSPHELKRQILSIAGVERPQQLLSIELMSFSYLHGIPPTSSLVFDVRFLPNPFFEEELRALPGSDPTVVRWLDGHEEVQEAVTRIWALVSFLLPRYGEELKTHLTLAVGCTGGRHRSVYVTERLSQMMRSAGYEVRVQHRDRDRWRYA